MKDKLYKQTIPTIIKGSDADPLPKFILSYEVVDTDGDLISISGMDIKQFKRNPVMLWGHDQKTPAIGKWKNIKKEKIDGVWALTAQAELFTDIDYELANRVAKIIDKGVLGTSIGYMPDFKSIERAEDEEGNTFTKYKKGKLFEASVVNLPANQEALRKSIDDGDITIEEIASLKEAVAAVELERVKEELAQALAENDKLLEEIDALNQSEDDFIDETINALSSLLADHEQHKDVDKNTDDDDFDQYLSDLMGEEEE